MQNSGFASESFDVAYGKMLLNSVTESALLGSVSGLTANASQRPLSLAATFFSAAADCFSLISLAFAGRVI